MELKEILSISKLPGLFRIIASRDNGLIVSPLNEDTKKFVSSRQHMFTPLENITIYTSTSNVELGKVFQDMKKKESEIPLPNKKDSSKKYREYFTQILPDHDQQRVYDNDIKKIVRWYKALDQHGVFSLDEEQKEASEKAGNTKNDKKDTPKKKKTKQTDK